MITKEAVSTPPKVASGIVPAQELKIQSGNKDLPASLPIKNPTAAHYVEGYSYMAAVRRELATPSDGADSFAAPTITLSEMTKQRESPEYIEKVLTKVVSHPLWSSLNVEDPPVPNAFDIGSLASDPSISFMAPCEFQQRDHILNEVFTNFDRKHPMIPVSDVFCLPSELLMRLSRIAGSHRVEGTKTHFELFKPQDPHRILWRYTVEKGSSPSSVQLRELVEVGYHMTGYRWHTVPVQVEKWVRDLDSNGLLPFRIEKGALTPLPYAKTKEALDKMPLKGAALVATSRGVFELLTSMLRFRWGTLSHGNMIQFVCRQFLMAGLLNWATDYAFTSQHPSYVSLLSVSQLLGKELSRAIQTMTAMSTKQVTLSADYKVLEVAVVPSRISLKGTRAHYSWQGGSLRPDHAWHVHLLRTIGPQCVLLGQHYKEPLIYYFPRIFHLCHVRSPDGKFNVMRAYLKKSLMQVVGSKYQFLIDLGSADLPPDITGHFISHLFYMLRLHSEGNGSETWKPDTVFEMVCEAPMKSDLAIMEGIQLVLSVAKSFVARRISPELLLLTHRSAVSGPWTTRYVDLGLTVPGDLPIDEFSLETHFSPHDQAFEDYVTLHAILDSAQDDPKFDMRGYLSQIIASRSWDPSDFDGSGSVAVQGF